MDYIDSDKAFSITDTPTLIQFSAKWCGPCMALTPKVVEIANANPELRVLKVDVEGCPKVVEQFDIRAVPTLVFLEGSQERGRLTGNVSADKINSLIGKHI